MLLIKNDLNINMEKKLTFLDPKIITSINDENIEKFNISDFEIGEKIMKIPNGYVAMAKKIKTNQIYSIKVLRKIDLLQNKISIEHEINQYQNLTLLYHPFIVELKGVNFTDPYNIFYLNEYIPGIPLKHLIKAEQGISIEKAKFYIACIITVLDYIHKKRIIHRDLRPDHILINKIGYVKIIDFTLSKQLKSDYTYSTCGIHEYYSPEMINKTGYNKCIDFWQLGILFYEMLFGKTPFVDQDPIKLYEKIKNGKLKFPRNIDINARTLIRHLLNLDANKRLGCTKKGIYEIIQNPFFEGFDWESLLHRVLEPPFIPKVNRNSIYNYKKLDSIYLEESNTPIPKEKDPFYNL